MINLDVYYLDFSKTKKDSIDDKKMIPVNINNINEPNKKNEIKTLRIMVR